MIVLRWFAGRVLRTGREAVVTPDLLCSWASA
jgi:hypothetical protein